MATIDIEAFHAREAQGLITCRPHPTEDLLIWNYTPQCQFQRAWDEVTMQARGLITCSDGTIVARVFTKFFNIEEGMHDIPMEPFQVTEKMDGSLIIISIHQGKLLVATRGNFASEQAEKAREIIQKRHYQSCFLPGWTYLFEVLYPSNRIVVDYGEREDLVLLAVIETEIGREIDIHSPLYTWAFPVVRHYDGIDDIAQLKALEEPNKEGFVLHFASGLRVKSKFSEYVRLHKLLTKCTARTIWETLRTNQSFDELLEHVPDEFYVWVQRTRNDLLCQFQEIEASCIAVKQQVIMLPTRKEQASIVVKEPYRGIIFLMLDNKSYHDAIWKLLYPAAERPFKIDDEG